jgi:hypothetical protein
MIALGALYSSVCAQATATSWRRAQVCRMRILINTRSFWNADQNG